MAPDRDPLPTYDTPPYSPEQALAITMIHAGLRQEAAQHRARAMVIELRAMGYELTQTRII